MPKQKEVAVLVGISQSTYCHHLQGQRFQRKPLIAVVQPKQHCDWQTPCGTNFWPNSNATSWLLRLDPKLNWQNSKAARVIAPNKRKPPVLSVAAQPRAERNTT